jgi:plastocyanin
MRQAAITTVSVFAISCLFGCGGGDDSGAGSAAPSSPLMTTLSTATPSTATPSTATSSTATSSTADLTIAGGAYDADLTVEPGATVTVHNTDSVPHNVVAENGSFRIDFIAPDEEAAFTAPSEPGQYRFVCTLQPNMRATLTVERPSSSGESSSGESSPGRPAPDDSTPNPSTTRTAAPGSPVPDGY